MQRRLAGYGSSKLEHGSLVDGVRRGMLNVQTTKTKRTKRRVLAQHADAVRNRRRSVSTKELQLRRSTQKRLHRPSAEYRSMRNMRNVAAAAQLAQAASIASNNVQPRLLPQLPALVQHERFQRATRERSGAAQHRVRHRMLHAARG